MPDLDLDQIVQKVFDLLTGDARTNGIDWQKGRFTPYDLRTFPAGGITWAPGIAIDHVTIPSGLGGAVPVMMRVWTSKHEGLGAAEQQIQDLIGKIMDVLFGTTVLQVASYSTKPWLESFTVQEVESNPEATPPFAEASLIASYRLRL